MKKPFKLKGILIGYLQNVIAGNNLYMILVPNPPKKKKIQISIVKVSD